MDDPAAGKITHDIEQELVVLRLEGDYTVVQLRAALTASLHDDRIVGPRWLLVDARQAAVNPPLHEIRSSIGVVTELREGFRFPVHIVVSSELHYGLGRMVSTLSGLVGMDVQIARDMDTARLAMGLPPEAG